MTVGRLALVFRSFLLRLPNVTPACSRSSSRRSSGYAPCGADYQRGHVRRHLRLLARAVGPTFHGPRLGAAPLPAFDAHHLRRDRGVARGGRRGRPARRRILQRYYADFSYVPRRLGALLFIVNENLREGSSARDVFSSKCSSAGGAELALQRACVFCAETAGIRIFIRGHIRMLSRHCSSGLRKEVI